MSSPNARMKHIGHHRSAAELVGHLASNVGLDDPHNDGVRLVDQDGNKIATEEQIVELADDWRVHEMSDAARRRGVLSRVMELSAPIGSDPKAVHKAAQEWAHNYFVNRSWVMALQTDEPHPHVHMTYAVRDHEGRRSYFKIGQFRWLYTCWVACLQDNGIDVEQSRFWREGGPSQ